MWTGALWSYFSSRQQTSPSLAERFRALFAIRTFCTDGGGRSREFSAGHRRSAQKIPIVHVPPIPTSLSIDRHRVEFPRVSFFRVEKEPPILDSRCLRSSLVLRRKNRRRSPRSIYTALWLFVDPLVRTSVCLYVRLFFLCSLPFFAPRKISLFSLLSLSLSFLLGLTDSLLPIQHLLCPNPNPPDLFPNFDLALPRTRPDLKIPLAVHDQSTSLPVTLSPSHSPAALSSRERESPHERIESNWFRTHDENCRTRLRLTD